MTKYSYIHSKTWKTFINILIGEGGAYKDANLRNNTKPDKRVSICLCSLYLDVSKSLIVAKISPFPMLMLKTHFYFQITRTRNKWKFYFKDGIMNLGGKDYVFQKSNGDAEW